MIDTYFLDLIGKLTKRDLKIEINGKIIEYKPAKKIQISPLFFRSHKCIRCGKCCNKFGSNLYWSRVECLIGDFTLPEELDRKIKTIQIKINGRKKYLYSYKNDLKKTHRCDLLKTQNNLEYCILHDTNMKPIHCSLPPIEFDKRKDTIIILKRLIKRNWRFGCKMELGKFDEEQFKLWDLVQLERLRNSAEDLGIKTYLDRIIKKLQTINKLQNKIQII